MLGMITNMIGLAWLIVAIAAGFCIVMSLWKRTPFWRTGVFAVMLVIAAGMACNTL